MMMYCQRKPVLCILLQVADEDTCIAWTDGEDGAP